MKVPTWYFSLSFCTFLKFLHNRQRMMFPLGSTSQGGICRPFQHDYRSQNYGKSTVYSKVYKGFQYKPNKTAKLRIGQCTIQNKVAKPRTTPAHNSNDWWHWTRTSFVILYPNFILFKSEWNILKNVRFFWGISRFEGPGLESLNL